LSATFPTGEGVRRVRKMSGKTPVANKKNMIQHHPATMNSPGLLLIAALCLAACATAEAQPQAMTFEAAWERVKASSDQLAAAQAAVDSKALQARGLKGLGGPVVSVSAAAYAYNANLNVNLDPINQHLAQISQRLPIPLQNLPIPVTLPQFPSSYTFNRHNTGTTQSISALWPIYTGGASDAARGFVGAQGSEARADADKTGHELATLLVQRYFGAQLADKAAALRQAALNDIQQHDSAAAKMLAAGVISRIERLQAQAAYEDAKRQSLKAHDEAELAAIAIGAWAAERTSAANWPQRFIFRRFLTQYLDIGVRNRQKLPSLGPIFASTSSAAQAPSAHGPV
jgi:outer membrane protein TolC